MGFSFPREGEAGKGQGNGKSKEDYRRKGNDQGRTKPQQWLVWGDLSLVWQPLALGVLPGAALWGFESLLISTSLTINISISHRMPGDVLGCIQAPDSAGGKIVHSLFHCPLPGRVGSGFARTRSCFGNSLSQESLFFLPSLFALLSPPPSFSLSANAQQMGGNAILNAIAS